MQKYRRCLSLSENLTTFAMDYGRVATNNVYILNGRRVHTSQQE